MWSKVFSHFQKAIFSTTDATAHVNVDIKRCDNVKLIEIHVYQNLANHVFGEEKIVKHFKNREI